jgi:hypothetical protein
LSAAVDAEVDPSAWTNPIPLEATNSGGGSENDDCPASTVAATAGSSSIVTVSLLLLFMGSVPVNRLLLVLRLCCFERETGEVILPSALIEEDEAMDVEGGG